MTHTLATCDEFDEVFDGPDGDGRYHLNNDCNPWIDGPGKCDTATELCSRRVIIIPIVDAFGNGSSDPLTVLEFALMFLEGYDSGKCQGNNCEVKARFVDADFTANGLSGVYDEGASILFVKLSE
jgi:hypothetical protein